MCLISTTDTHNIIFLFCLVIIKTNRLHTSRCYSHSSTWTPSHVPCITLFTQLSGGDQNHRDAENQGGVHEGEPEPRGAHPRTGPPPTHRPSVRNAQGRRTQCQ